jgi:rubrerythrin
MDSQNKVHPAASSFEASGKTGRHEGTCADCKRPALLSIFRRDGLCNNCRIARDVEAVKRVADEQTKRVQRAITPDAEVQRVEELHLPASLAEAIAPPVAETVIYCESCGRHRVAEKGQQCPICSAS